MTDALIGLDIGGTTIAAGVVIDGRVTARRTAPTPRTGGHDVVRRAAELVEALRGDTPVEAGVGGIRVGAIGVGAPGTVDPATGVVTSCTDVLPGWLDTPIAELLTARAGLPVSVDNDVRAAALAHTHDPVLAGHRRVLHVSLGTGVGGALSCDGRILRGTAGTAGEIAHLLVPEPGEHPCGCGRRDHLEAVAAGPAIAAAYRARAGAGEADLVEVAARLRDGDRAAAEVVEHAGLLLGRTLSGLVTALDVDAVLVAGGAAGIGSPLLDPLSRALHAETRPPGRVTPVLRPTVPDAPVLGAALLAAHPLPGGHREP
ncbi:ROK family protein [Pseudonocardia nantongensis]|uniref:ROK family protein n=1 Tax=Pseudonocardia nantongensis TaxID=1181885 RepID=UPI00397B995B